MDSESLIYMLGMLCILIIGLIFIIRKLEKKIVIKSIIISICIVAIFTLMIVTGIIDDIANFIHQGIEIILFTVIICILIYTIIKLKNKKYIVIKSFVIFICIFSTYFIPIKTISVDSNSRTTSIGWWRTTKIDNSKIGIPGIGWRITTYYNVYGNILKREEIE